MSSQLKPPLRPSRLDIIWLVMVAATLVMFWLGESGTSGRAGWRAVVVMFSLSLIKGVMVIWDFMELRRAPWMWRVLLIGWLVGVIVFIVSAYAIAAALNAH